jgi:predicted SAM-dependent methyltransferase
MYKDGSEYVVPRNYSSSINSDTKEEEILWQKILDSITKYLHKHKISEKEYNYLEVGIGEGKLFNFFKKHTNIACGIEPGVWGKQENCIIYSDIQDVPKEISFDIMVANDVLEHLTEPKEMLSLMHQKANDGCIVRCTFPNKDSLKAKMQKGTWHMVRPFGHLHYFSKRSIENLFEQAGWTIVELEATRIAQNSALDLIKKFDTKERNILYRIVKSLLLGQILLGKDQWVVIAKKSSQ